MEKQRRPILVEPNFSEMLWSLLAQWKMLLIVSIITAILVPAVKYCLEKNSYEAELSERSEIQKMVQGNPDETDKQIQNVLNSLPREDRIVINQLLEMDKLVSERDEYMQNSLIMSLNPFDLESINMGFRIHDVEDISMMFAIGEGYSKIINDDSAVEIIKTAIDPEMDLGYIKELIKTTHLYNPIVDSEDASIIEVTIIVPEGTNKKRLSETVEKAFSVYSKKLQKTSTHKLDLVYCNYGSDEIYTNIESQKNDKLYWGNNIATYRKNIVTALTENQKRAYEQINNIIGLSGESEAAAEAYSAPSEPSLDKRMAIVGFIMGLFMYAFIYMLYATFNIKASSSKDAAYYSGTRILGEYCYAGKEKGLKSLLHSNWILKIKKGKITTHEDQINAIQEAITATCKNHNICSFDIISMVKENDISSDIIRCIRGCAEETGGSARTIDFSDDVNESKLTDVKNAVLIIGNDTRLSTIDKLISLASDYNVYLMGTIYLYEA